jgi:glycosyltransferase involved in cell wall biosynthesis
MAVYNGMPFLLEAVTSMAGQSYKNFEFIIVNDASTDGTLKYLKNLKDKRIKIISNPKNLGLATSLNKALAIARGQYIARMDADDVSLPKRLETQLRFMDENPKISLCGCWADLINERGEKIGVKRYPAQHKKIKSSLIHYSCIIHPTFFARRELYEELKGYDPAYDFAEDYELLMRARNKFQMANIDKTLLKWRLWSKRRSRQDMHFMDKIDFKIKLESLERDGFSPNALFSVVTKYFMTYILPSNVKIKLAKKLKLA